MCVGLCVDMCVGLRVDMCAAICVHMCVDMCADMCVDILVGFCSACAALHCLGGFTLAMDALKRSTTPENSCIDMCLDNV